MPTMRTKKDGGCSLCNASDENVGKRRCCHVLDNASIEVRKERGTNFIDISDKDTTVSVKANQAKIKSFISSLSSGLNEKERNDILAVLREG